jgi:hypothetical protein
MGRIINRSGPCSLALIIQTNPVPYKSSTLATRFSSLVSRVSESTHGEVTGEKIIFPSDWACARCDVESPSSVIAASDSMILFLDTQVVKTAKLGTLDFTDRTQKYFFNRLKISGLIPIIEVLFMFTKQTCFWIKACELKFLRKGSIFGLMPCPATDACIKHPSF